MDKNMHRNTGKSTNLVATYLLKLRKATLQFKSQQGTRTLGLGYLKYIENFKVLKHYITKRNTRSHIASKMLLLIMYKILQNTFLHSICK